MLPLTWLPDLKTDEAGDVGVGTKAGLVVATGRMPTSLWVLHVAAAVNAEASPLNGSSVAPASVYLELKVLGRYVKWKKPRSCALL